MTSTAISAAAGIVLSLAFSYIPGLSEWFAKQTSQYKSLVMLALLLVVTTASFGLSCSGVVVTFTCDKVGGILAATNFFAAVVANQATYSLSPQTAAVLAIKAARVAKPLPIPSAAPK
jgi:hypothetical protein